MGGLHENYVGIHGDTLGDIGEFGLAVLRLASVVVLFSCSFQSFGCLGSSAPMRLGVCNVVGVAEVTSVSSG